MTRTLAPVAALAALAALASCGSSHTTPTAELKSGLEQVAGCDDLVARLRARAIGDMNALLDANLQAALGMGFGSSAGGMPMPGSSTGGMPMPTASPPSTATPTTDGAATRSDTNVQVPGVDEPDLVKTDGAFAYVVADGRLQILDVWPAAETRRVATLPIEGTPTKLLLRGDRVVVFSSLAAEPSPGPLTTMGLPAMPAVVYGGGECTYGYECVPQGDGRPAKLTFVDVSDPAAPRVVRELTFSGTLLAARRIDSAVHAVVSSGERVVSGLEFWPALSGGESAAQIRAAFEALRSANRTLIEAASADVFLPTVRDARGGAVEVGVLGGCASFWASAEGKGNGTLSVVSLDVAGDGPLHAVTAVGRPGFVYVSPSTLYVAAPVGQRWAWNAPVGAETTAIHAFTLRGGAEGAEPGADYAGSGAVRGRPLSSFSFDERDGALRVATTTGHAPSPDARSAVTVLLPASGGLAEVGRVDGIAPGEDIRAVRFDGARGFVVTFKKTDPLFVLDLADPAAPRVAGELVVPGFSTYMQLMDPAHLLTLGYDADDQGSFAWFQGIQLQVFDVADMARPSLAWRDLVGTRGSSSGAATDHLAFNYFAPKDLLAIPLTICTGATGGWTTGDVMTFSGLGVWRVTTAAGFHYLGGVAHRPAETPGTYSGACASWWTSPNTVVQRSVFLEDYVLSFTREELRVQDTGNLGTDLARVDLTAL